MLIVLLALLVIALGISLAVTILHDGYGIRPAPRSHIESFPRAHSHR